MVKIIPWDAVFILINLLILYVIMRFVLIKPIKGVLEKREQMIRSGLDNAAAPEENAKAPEKQWKEKTDGADAESAQIISKAKADARNEYDRLVSEANSEAAKIIGDARRMIEDERAAAAEGIRAKAAELAVDTTRKVLESSDLSGIDDSLYEKFLTETGERNGSDSK